MKAIVDRTRALSDGLAAIRTQFQLPGDFPPDAEEAARDAAKQPLSGHVDRTTIPFVTLDPASSTDLDQAFAIEQAGGDLILRYAIADIGWFVRPDGPIDREAWIRGETLYLPDGKISLYPTVLCEGAASLLPDGDKPAIVFAVRVDPDGAATLDGAERAIIKSRAKLAYATVKPDDLPSDFADLSNRITAAEDARGASRVDPPQQQVSQNRDGSFVLEFRPMTEAEIANASLSLAANLAIADALYQHGTGLFRVMAEPDDWAVRRLRRIAKGLGVDWAKDVSLDDRQSQLDPNDMKDAAFMLAVRRAGAHASYSPLKSGERPWHSAMRATYVHATAPLRRLADRYVTEAALAIANGQSVPDWVSAAFAPVGEIMNTADAKTGQVDSAVLELAEAVALASCVGRTFDGTVTDIDQRGARIQISDPAVVTRIPAGDVEVGQDIRLRLDEADPARRLTRFSAI